MIRYAMRTMLVLVLGAAFGYAADVNGRWVGKLELPQGDMELAYTFKVEGTALTGTVEVMGTEAPLEEGKVDGTDMSFKVVAQDSGIEYLHRGKISGDTIQMTIEGPYNNFELVLTRSAGKSPAP